MNNKLYEKDIRSTFELFDRGIISNSTILVTGATGMICSCVVDMLMQWNLELDANNIIYAISRSVDKLKTRFAKYEGNEKLRFLEIDAAQPFELNVDVDYIIHGASNADPASMMNNPVETLKSNVLGMDCLLNCAVEKKVKRTLYISSGEMYGKALEELEHGFPEDYSGYINYSEPRTCYPSGKRAAETLCQCYIKQYDADVVIVRPCHIYGPTMLWSDSRAISAFIKNGINGEKIIMKSAGTLVRSHCYVVDAASAILYVLLYGEKGEAYNVADKKSICSIAELAHTIAEEAGTEVEMVIPTDAELAGFAKRDRAVLDATKLENMGWQALSDLRNGIKKTICILKDNI